MFLDPVTTLRRLGYRDDAKLLIIHGDDAGMCYSANIATAEALKKGIVTSTSVMVPCPWFLHFAEWAKANPEADIGIHLTMTSEWDHYRWRPLTPADRVPSLVDKDGFFSGRRPRSSLSTRSSTKSKSRPGRRSKWPCGAGSNRLTSTATWGSIRSLARVSFSSVWGKSTTFSRALDRRNRNRLGLRQPLGVRYRARRRPMLPDSALLSRV